MRRWILLQRAQAERDGGPRELLTDASAANINAIASLLGEKPPYGAEQENGDSEIDSDATPEQELLEFFLEHQPEMATFMTLQAEELDEGDRRKVYFAGLNAMKRAYIRVGDPIPAILFDLERRFLGEQ
jgi:hypothetical protein